MSWKLETEFIGMEPVDEKLPDGDKTELRKITATHIETGNTYFLKARTGTAAYKKAAWDEIWRQHTKRTKEPEEDAIATEGVAYLNAKETG